MELTSAPLDREVSAPAQAAVVARILLLNILVGGACFAVARYGLSLAIASKQVPAIWPPTGIALATLWVLGNRVWPGIFLAALFAATAVGEPLLVACCLAAGSTASPLIGARILHAARFDATLERGRDVMSLLSVAISAPLVSATVGATALTAASIVPWSGYSNTWWAWWTGDGLGILIVAALLLTWLRQPRIQWRGARLVELVGYVAILVLLSLVVFVLPTSNSAFFFPRAYVAFPLVAWAGLRMGAREAALGVALIAAFALWGALQGVGPFVRQTPDSRMVLLAAYIATVACMALLIAAVTAERQGARTRLREAYDELEARVRARTVELASAVEELGQRNQEKETLLREIHHRVKNNLQVVCSLLNLQAHGHDEPGLVAFAEECKARVRSMALVHEHLYKSNNLQSVPLTSYLGALVEEIAHTQPSAGRVACRVDIQEITLPVDQAIPCGLVVNELVTNAFKHAFPENRSGSVEVSMSEEADGRIELVVRDDGVGTREGVSFCEGGGFGLTLVAMLADQLDARLDLERRPGTRIRVGFARRRPGAS